MLTTSQLETKEAEVLSIGLAGNAGAEVPLIDEQLKILKGNMDHNVIKRQSEDLVLSGVIDPTQVTRLTLRKTASPMASC